jgi:hypothetical protein
MAATELIARGPAMSLPISSTTRKAPAITAAAGIVTSQANAIRWAVVQLTAAARLPTPAPRVDWCSSSVAPVPRDDAALLRCLKVVIPRRIATTAVPRRASVGSRRRRPHFTRPGMGVGQPAVIGHR